MRIFSLSIVILGLTISSAFGAGKENDGPNTTITIDDIISHIEKERPLLKPGHKVDLISAFKEKDSVFENRFGNRGKVLNLKGMSFSGQDMRGVNLRLAKLRNCNLIGADFRGADLVHVDLSGANVRGADFSGADLSRANFTNTDIGGAKFYNTNLYKTNFSKAKGTTGDNLRHLISLTNKYRLLKKAELKGRYD